MALARETVWLPESFPVCSWGPLVFLVVCGLAFKDHWEQLFWGERLDFQLKKEKVLNIFCVCVSTCLRVCVCTMCVSGAQRGQRKALDPLELGLDSCEPSCRGWESNPSPRQPVPLTLSHLWPPFSTRLPICYTVEVYTVF